MSCTLAEMHKVCGSHYFVTKYYSKYYSSLEMLSAAIKTVVGAYNNSLPGDGNLTQTGDSRVGKFKFENLKCQISHGCHFLCFLCCFVSTFMLICPL